jgi:hypothetical protein
MKELVLHMYGKDNVAATSSSSAESACRLQDAGYNVQSRPRQGVIILVSERGARQTLKKSRQYAGRRRRWGSERANNW